MMGFKTYELNQSGGGKVCILLDEVISFQEIPTQGGMALLVHMSGGQTHPLSGVTFDEFNRNFPFQQAK